MGPLACNACIAAPVRTAETLEFIGGASAFAAAATSNDMDESRQS
jgi:hypothetical protein